MSRRFYLTLCAIVAVLAVSFLGSRLSRSSARSVGSRVSTADTGANPQLPSTAATQTAPLGEEPSPVAVNAPAHLPRLWSKPSHTTGTKLQPSSAAFFAARARGVSQVGRVAIVTRSGPLELAALSPGETFVLPLPGGEELLSRANLVVRDVGGIVRVGGEFIGRSGGFALHERAGALAGTILLPDRGIACEIVTRAGGELEIREIPLGEVICDPLPREPFSAEAAPSDRPLAAPPLLSSRPAATAVLYLDFDGETVSDPNWNSGNPVVAAASALSNTQITEVWNRVKEDYWGFNVDVTTDASRYASAPVGRRMRCIITPTSSWYGSAGGVAFRNSFRLAGSTYSSTIPCWVFNTTTSGVAEAVAHELGHTFGLRHDGDSSQTEGSSAAEYYAGHGSGAFSWAPIMGSSYSRTVTQWSKGEYPNANNLEDDIAIIANTDNGVGFAADEAGETASTATPLFVASGVFERAGAIAHSGDVDFYSVTVTQPAALNVTASVAAFGPNLDVSIALQDSAGAVLATPSADFSLSATLVATVPAGTFFLRVSGQGRATPLAGGYSSFGSVGAYSLSGSLGNVTAPTIAPLPASLSVVAGTSTSMSASASGTGPLNYQWRRNAVPLTDGSRVTGARTATLTLAGIAIDDTGAYSVVVSNGAGSATSTATQLTVNIPPPPVISSQPYHMTAAIGSSTAISVYVSPFDTPGATYQWYRNGIALPGSTSSSHGISSVSIGDLGDYHVVVQNAGGSVISAIATLSLSGSPAYFWADARERNGVAYFLFSSPGRLERYDLASEAWLPSVALPGVPTRLAVADNAIFIASGRSIARYNLALSSSAAFANSTTDVLSLVSAGAHLVVGSTFASYSSYFDLMAYDAATGAKTDQRLGTSLGGRELGYSAESGRLFGRSASYSPSDILSLEFRTDGTFGDSLESPYHGSYPDATRVMPFGRGSFVADDSGTVYRTPNLTYAGTLGGRTLDLVTTSGTDVFTLRSSRVAMLDGQFLETGSVALARYAFRLAQNSTRLIAFSQPDAAGGMPPVEKVVYASFRENAAAVVPLDAMGRRITPGEILLDENGIAYVYSAAHQNIFRWSTAQRRYLPPIAISAAARYVAYSAANRALYFDDGAKQVRQVLLDSGSLGERAFWNAADQLRGLQTAGAFVFAADPTGAWDSHYTISPAGETLSAVEWNYYSRQYTWSPALRRMFHFRDDSSPNDLHWEAIGADGKIGARGESPYHGAGGLQLPIRVAPDGSVILLGSGFLYQGTTVELTGSLANAINDAAWVGGGLHTIRESGSTSTEAQTWSMTTNLLQRSATLPGRPHRLFALGADRLFLVTSIDGFLHYRILNSSTLTVISEDTTSQAATATPPVIIAQPAGRVVLPGGVASFSVSAFSSAPLAYQWRRDGINLSNGANVSGATSAILTLSSLQAADAAAYSVVVSNTLGSETSTAATLGFASAPALALQPASLALASGGSGTMAISATGTAPLIYQWRKNGVIIGDDANVTGTNTAMLRFVNAAVAQAGSYAVVVANAAGFATSSSAALSIGTANTVPLIVTAPRNQTVVQGQPASFMVEAVGAGPLAYQWRRQGVVLAEGTGATLNLANVQGAHEGDYTVTVSNGAGNASAGARLTVLVPPAISTQPRYQIVALGGQATFTVVASGTPTLRYRWRKNGADLAADGRITGGATAVLVLSNVQNSDTGVYDVVISNTAGTLASAGATLAIAQSGPSATHFAPAGGYPAGGTFSIVNTLAYSGSATALGWDVLLPAGWSYVSSAGDEGTEKPAANATGTIGWAWAAPPTGAIAFTYVVRVPPGETGSKEVVALVTIRSGGEMQQILARPDPLRLTPATFHAADTDLSGAINLFELTRVIELYNTRNGTVRTGCYRVDIAGEDGFAADSPRAAGSTAALTRYHSADTRGATTGSPRDGAIDLFELTRVIELYNTRAGTVRTGRYRVLAGTEDGFAAGP